MEALSVQARASVDITRVTEVTAEVAKVVDELFEHQPWDERQVIAGKFVRGALAAAVKTIIVNVPPCPTRSVAIRKIIEARMDCNAAITHRGRY